MSNDRGTVVDDAAKAACDAYPDVAARDSSGGFLPVQGFPREMERTVRRTFNSAVRQGLSAELTMNYGDGRSFTIKVGPGTSAVGNGGAGGKRDSHTRGKATAAPPGLSPGGTNFSNRQSSENQRQQPRHPARRAAKFREQAHAPSAAAPVTEEPNDVRVAANPPSQTQAASPTLEERSIIDATGASLPDARKALLTANGDVDRAAETLLAPAEAPAASAVGDTSSAEGNANAQSTSSTTRPTTTTRSRRAAAPAPTIDDLLATNTHQHRPRAAGYMKGHEMPGHKPEDPPPPSRTRTARRGKG